MSNTKDDPRDAALETKPTLPKTWHKETNDGLSTSGMFLSGLIMVTRNRFIAWPAVVFGINSLINQHPIRTKDGGTSPWASLFLSIAALFASYLPLLLLTKSPFPK